MPELLSREEALVEVDFYGFALQDFDDGQVPVGFPEGWERGPFLTSRPGRLDFTSGGHTHTATLVIEVWDSEPLEPVGNWEETALAKIACASGNLEARGVASGPMPEPITLSDGSETWQVRAVCSGREEVAAATRLGVPEGVERYVLQFWPHS
jgi:hypothetical protein